MQRFFPCEPIGRAITDLSVRELLRVLCTKISFDAGLSRNDSQSSSSGYSGAGNTRALLQLRIRL